MSISNVTTLAYLMKTDYSVDGVMDVVTRDKPLWKSVNKQKGKPAGNQFTYALKYANVGSVGASFSTMQANVGQSKGTQINVGSTNYYGLIQLDGPSLLRATDRGSFVELFRDQADSTLEAMSERMSFNLFHAGSGIRGRRSSISSSIVTLTTGLDARNFRPGMLVGASANSDGSSPRTGSTTVDSVDIDTGTVTLTDQSQITSFADNDYLFTLSDNNGACLDGLQTLVPLTAPTAGESFRGHDRTKAMQWLAGSRISNTSAPVHENILSVGTSVSGIGGKLDISYVSPEAFTKVTRILSAKVEYDGEEDSPTYGFMYAAVATPAGIVKLMADSDCPQTQGFALRAEDLAFLYLGDAPVHIIRTPDGAQSRDIYNADGIEMRVRSVNQTALYRPRNAATFAT